MDTQEDTPRIEGLSVTGVGHRFRWTDDEKVRIVEESYQSGETVDEVARPHHVSRSQLYDWRHRHMHGRLGGSGAEFMHPWIEQKTSLTLAASQAEAIQLALRSKLKVITGGLEVGKTTIVNSILRILTAKAAKLLLCAPTGGAAKRMTEATGMEAKTIHRLLEFDPKALGFKRN